MSSNAVLTMKDRYSIYSDFLAQKYPTKVALGLAYGVSPRTVNRSIQMVEEQNNKDFVDPPEVDQYHPLAEKAVQQPLNGYFTFGPWKENEGTMPVSQGTLVQVIFYDGEPTQVVPAGEDMCCAGEEYDFLNWSYEDSSIDGFAEDWGLPYQLGHRGGGDIKYYRQAFYHKNEDVDDQADETPLQYMISDKSVMIVVDGKPRTISATHQNYRAIKLALVEERFAEAKDLIDIVKSIKKFTKGKINVEGGQLSYDGYPMNGVMVQYILDKLEEGIEPTNVINFMDNLMQNPSHRSVNELWGFLQTQKMPITEDGHFLAYKRIRDDYTDSYTGKIDNSVGSICTMPRNMVDDNKEQTCSMGLHFCSKGYVRSFRGERLVVLKINPKDVVSVPVDYHNTKGRCCRYEVVGELRDADDDLSEFL